MLLLLKLRCSRKSHWVEYIHDKIVNRSIHTSKPTFWSPHGGSESFFFERSHNYVS